jgi:sialic acid synthase SpsE
MKEQIQIIAEIAQGFEGNFDQSKLLIRAAAKAGADAVKFQLVYADELSTEGYQYYSLFQSLEMSDNQWQELFDYANFLGSTLIVDVFGAKSLATAEKIGIKTIKVHGTDVTNLGLLESISKSYIPKIILGVGGAYWTEIKTALQLLKDKEVVLLCGFQGYPTASADNQINRMQIIHQKAIGIHSNFQMGFADHPVEDQFQHTISITALGAGARVLEKHLTLGKVMELEDFESALNPDEFQIFVKQIKMAYDAIGVSLDQDDFGMSIAEKTYRNNVRRDVVAVINLEKGTVLNPQDLALKRTGKENVFKDLNIVIGNKLKHAVKKNQPIFKDDIIQ